MNTTAAPQLALDQKPKPKRPDIFWGEIAPPEHLVQFYDDEAVFLDTLEGFVGGGLRVRDAVVVIATNAHLRALERRLESHGYNVDAARATGYYLALDAQATLSEFMVQGWPDEELFRQLVTSLVTRARREGRRVRAFGEMVALLWAQGHNGATVRLEYLWHSFCQTQGFSLFCAYPKSGFTEDCEESMKKICAAHSMVV